MKAMILAAGKGTRLKPLTNKIPKPMLPINGKPLILYHIDLFKKHGFKEIIINLHHLPGKIREFLGDGEKFGVKITYSFEPTILGTAGAVKKVEAYFESKPCLIFYGDSLTNVNLTELVKYHQKKDGKITVGLYQWDLKEVHLKSIVVLGENNRILKFIEKPKKEEAITNVGGAGIYVLEPEILSFIPKDTFYDFGKDLFPNLVAQDIPMFGYEIKGCLLDIGTPQAYQKAQEDVPRGALL